MYSEGDVSSRSSSSYRISVHHTRSNAMDTQESPQTASENVDSSFDSGGGRAGSTRFIRDPLRESRQVADENVNSVFVGDRVGNVLKSKKQKSEENFEESGDTVTSPKVFLGMDKETKNITHRINDLEAELKEGVTAKFRMATPEELDKNVKNYGSKENNDNSTYATSESEIDSMKTLGEVAGNTEENTNQTDENSNQTETTLNSKLFPGIESQTVFDRSTDQGTGGSETSSPVTLRNKRRAGNSIDSFTATPSELLKRRSAEIVQLRRKLEAKMKRKSLQGYCLSDDEDTTLLNKDRLDPRTLRRPLSALGNLCRDNRNEAVFSANSSCNSSNNSSYCSTPIHRQQYRDNRPPLHAIDSKKLRYILGDPCYSPNDHRGKCTHHNQRCKSAHNETCYCDYRYSDRCTEHTSPRPCYNNRCSDKVTNIKSTNLCCHHTCESYSNHLCSHSPSHHRNSNFCGGHRSYNPCGHCNCSDTCDNHRTCESNCRTIPYNPCDNQCFNAIPRSKSCNCDHKCHASGAYTPRPSESCSCSAVSSPCRSSKFTCLQHTSRSDSPYQDAEGFESQYHTPLGSPRPVKSIRPAQG